MGRGEAKIRTEMRARRGAAGLERGVVARKKCWIGPAGGRAEVGGANTWGPARVCGWAVRDTCRLSKGVISPDFTFGVRFPLTYILSVFFFGRPLERPSPPNPPSWHSYQEPGWCGDSKRSYAPPLVK